MWQTWVNAGLRSLIWFLGSLAWAYSRKPDGSGFLDVRSDAVAWIGLMLLVAGWTLHIWSNLSLTRAERALTGPTGLAAQGPFRYVRNPIYLAGAPILLGIYFLYGDWRSDSESLVLLVVLALWFHFAVTRIEEPELRKRFGPAYEEYRRRVPRWLPRVP